MKLPRDISGDELAKSLKKFGYKITRQSGSHLRLTTFLYGEHHITIPQHNPLRIGTLSNILANVGEHCKLTREKIISELF